MEQLPMRKPYPSDMTDAQWGIIEPMIPISTLGRPREVDMREVCNAIFYLNRSGCQWDMLPHDFPPRSTVHEYYAQWRKDGTWQKILDTLRQQVRVAAGRDPNPSAGSIDSQTVKATEIADTRGYDGGKKVNGRKRHLVVDTLGLLLVVLVTAASVQDRDGGARVLDRLRFRMPSVAVVWADGGYAGRLVAYARELLRVTVDIVRKRKGQRTFEVLPRRWVVERTLSWISRRRRLAHDYERLPEHSEAMVKWAMVGLMARRLAPAPGRRPWEPAKAS